jgi:hypothetical protein
MSEELKNKIYATTECLSEQTMFDYIDDKISEKERHTVEKHLLDCELCSDAMEGLQLLKHRNKISIINKIIDNRILLDAENEAKLFSINYKIVFSIAAGIALLIGGIFFFNTFTLSEMKNSDVAELKKHEPANTFLGSKSDSIKSFVPSSNSESKVETAEDFSRKKLKDKEISSTSANKEVITQTVPQYDEQVTVLDLKEEANKGEGAEMDNTISNTKSVTAPDTDFKRQIPAVSDSPKASVIQREQSAAIDESKKAEEKKGINDLNNKYAKTARDKAGATKKNDITSNGDREVLSKKTVKNNKFRAEQKEKDKALPKKNIYSTEGISISENVSPVAPSAPAVSSETIALETPTLGGVQLEGKSSNIIDSALTNVEQMPEFPGGKDSLTKFIRKNFNYTNKPNTDPIKRTRIYVQFIVDKNGTIKNLKVLKGINPLLDKEAMRVMNMMPKWKPGKQNGENVSVIINYPIQLEYK